jgi:recombination protein RecA
MSQTRAKPSPATQGPGGDRGPKDKALQAAIGEIEKSYGKGAIMRLGDDSDLMREIRGISTGSLALDIALGGKGLPRGGRGAPLGRRPGKTADVARDRERAARGRICAAVDAEHALDPARKLGGS